MTEILELRDVTKSFHGHFALRSVNLSVGQGEIVGFVGPNGAGKSTCLRICVGILRRDSGSARVLGLDPSRDSLAIRRRTHYLTGETSIYHQMTGNQFLDFARHGYPIDDSALQIAPELFDLPLAARIRGYSAGMKQRLVLRAALTTGVELLILDEPDRALDATARMELRTVLTAIRAKGRSVLLSSHHLSEIEAIADRSVFLLNGKCIPDEIVRAAREHLRGEVRLQLTRDVALPDGYSSSEPMPDGTLRIRVDGDPFAWLARLDSADVETAEVGATRLEDLYRELTQESSTR